MKAVTLIGLDTASLRSAQSRRRLFAMTCRVWLGCCISRSAISFIRTDEELMIAKTVCRVLGIGGIKENRTINKNKTQKTKGILPC